MHNHLISLFINTCVFTNLVTADRSEEVDAAIHALEEEQRTFREEYSKVIELQAQTDVQLGVKERWRIPIVLAKVAQNRRLSGADSAIWAAMARNLAAGDDIDKVAEIALRVVTTAPVAPGANALSTDQQTSHCAAHPTPLPTPIQSPVATTRMYTPKTAVTQGRLFAGTVSSQNRANAIEETLSKPHKAGRKFFKRGAHKTSASPKGKKSHRRPAKHDAPLTSTGVDDKIGFEADETTFVGQLASTLATIATSISGKFGVRNTTRIHDRMHDTAEEEPPTASVSALASAHGSMKKGVSVTCRESEDPDTFTGSHKHLGVPSASTSSSKEEYAPSRLGDCPAPLTNQRSLFRIGSGASNTERSEDLDAAQDPPRKRRSYFGSLLASFARTDSGADLVDLGALQEQATLKKQSSRPSQLFFGEALTRLMSWRHHDQVVPAQ